VGQGVASTSVPSRVYPAFVVQGIQCALSVEHTICCCFSSEERGDVDRGGWQGLKLISKISSKFTVGVKETTILSIG